MDYTRGGTKANEPLQPLHTLFSDNIVAFMPLNDELIKDIEKIKEKMKKENKNKTINDEDKGETPNKQLVKIAQELLPTMIATIKRVFNDLSLDVSNRDIKPTYRVNQKSLGSQCVTRKIGFYFYIYIYQML